MDTDVGQQQEITPKESMQKRKFWIEDLKNILSQRKIIFYIGICLCFAVVITLFYRGEEDCTQTHGKHNEVADVLALSKNYQYLEKFAIDIRDENGRYRVLLCDMVLMLEPGIRIEKDIPALRGVVYHALRKRGAEIIAPRFVIRNLKEELIRQLDAYLGEKSISDIYFTRYILL